MRLKELADAQRVIEPRSAQFAEQQRIIFLTLEKFLDVGVGSCLLRHPAAAGIIIEELDGLTDWRVAVPHFTIMPNHWHALLVPADDARPLSAIMKRAKGRTARRIRQLRGGTDPLWQREWFDRWIRDDAEWEKCVAYIRRNPVKAGLAKTWTEHPWTR